MEAQWFCREHGLVDGWVASEGTHRFHGTCNIRLVHVPSDAATAIDQAARQDEREKVAREIVEGLKDLSRTERELAEMYDLGDVEKQLHGHASGELRCAALGIARRYLPGGEG